MSDKERKILNHHYISREVTDRDIDTFISRTSGKSPGYIMIKGLFQAVIIFLCMSIARGHAQNIAHVANTGSFRAFKLMLLYLIIHPVILPALILFVTLTDLIYNIKFNSNDDTTRQITASIIVKGVAKEARKSGIFYESIREIGMVMQSYKIDYDEDYLDEIAAFLTDTVKKHPDSLPFVTYIMDNIRSGSKQLMAKGIIYAEVVMDQLKFGNEDILYPNTPSLSNYIFFRDDAHNLTKEIEESKNNA